MRSRIKTIIGTLLVLGVLGAAGFVGFLYSGLYSVAADKPHSKPFLWGIETFKRHSIARHAGDIAVPELEQADLVRRGFELYRQECEVCHGAPGVGRDQVGWGINPDPPLLYTRGAEWSDAELYWIISHGIRLAGMPAFGPSNDERDIWALVAFTRRLADLSMQDYSRMRDAMDGRIPAEAVDWLELEDAGFERMAREGNAERGAMLLDAYGCGGCHVIPGIRLATGGAGPPLDRWAERHFIAGLLLNTPANLVRWTMDPQAIEPGTTMPNLGVTEAEARDMAAYLFRLGKAPVAWHTRGQR